MRLIAFAALLRLAAADWQYRSRPDLSPPRLNITVPADHARTESGYLVLAAYPGFGEDALGPEQPGAYILRDDGDLVWSGVGYFGGWVANLAVDEYRGQPVLRAFQGLLDAPHGRMYGDHVILDQHYRTIKTVRAGAHRLVSAHEFRIVDGKSVLIETPVAKPVDLRPWGGEEGQDWIVSGGFQELDIETGEVLFEWYSFDHVDPKYGVFPLNSGDEHVGTGRNTSDAWNYFHINSIDKNDEGDYLISARNYAAIFKINGTSGAVLWQLGGDYHHRPHHPRRSSFRLAPDAAFAFQHDARFLDRSPDGTVETISFFDNAAHSTDVRTNAFSRARIVRLDHAAGTASALATYPAPDGLSAASQGSARRLPNGNVFVNWGQAGAVTEFAPAAGPHTPAAAGSGVLFHAYLDSAPAARRVQSYRAFRANWTGFSAEEPAVAAESASGGATASRLRVYVSWNGDTRTAVWRFYGAEAAGGGGRGRGEGSRGRLLAEAERTGFETVVVFDAPTAREGSAVAVIAVAVDAKGEELGRSRPVPVSRRVLAPPAWDASASRPLYGQKPL